jgi:ankyrin repeat protein
MTGRWIRRGFATAALLALLPAAASALTLEPPESELGRAIRRGDEATIGRYLSDPALLAEAAPGHIGFGPTHVALAAQYGRLDLLKALCAADTSVEKHSCRGDQPIHDAAQQGHLEVVRWLLAQGASPNPAVGDRHPPLVAAIVGPLVPYGSDKGSARDAAGVVRLLLEAGANPAVPDHWGYTPLARAVQRADARIVRLLLAFGADPRQKTEKIPTPLDLAKERKLDYIAGLLAGPKPPKEPLPDPPLVAAVKAGDVAALKRALADGAAVDARDGGGSTALVHAAARGNAEAASLLLAAGADPSTRNQGNATALMHAASNDHEGIVEALLAKRADPGATDYGGNSAIRYAVIRGHAGPVARLAAGKADVESPGEGGTTLLMTAAADGSAPVIKALLAAGAKVDARDEAGRTALMYAAKEGKAEVVDLLVAAGADVEARDRDGATALRMATDGGHSGIASALMRKSPATPDRGALSGALSNGDVDLVKSLLSKGIAPDPQAGENPPLVAAAGAWKNRLALVKALVEAGARAEVRDADGKTPLMEAARWSGDEPTEVVKYLLAHGADPKARDRKGVTAWRRAMEEGHNATAKALEAAGASAEFTALAWSGHFFPAKTRKPGSYAIEDREAWAALWKEIGRDGEAPEIDFGRFAAAFVLLEPIEGPDTEGVAFGKPALEGEALVVPWSTHRYVVYDLFSSTPWGVAIVDRQGSKRIGFKGGRTP